MRWCTCTNMAIRVDKCVSFGIKNSSTSSTQFLPKLIINRKLVPIVNLGESFKYLGHDFNFSMDNSKHMSILLETTSDLMIKIDQLPCHPKYKLSLFHCVILSKIAWHLTIADLSKTWVEQNLDTIVGILVCHQLESPLVLLGAN